MTDPIAARHALACTLARAAGAHAHALFDARATLAIEAKASSQDVVSRADRELEAMIRDRIAAEFPADGILGEEDAPKRGTSGFTCVIDPIDGTMPFLSGLPHWCVAIAVVDADHIQAAATFAPVYGMLYHAIRGGGAFRDDERLTLRDDLALTGALTAVGASDRVSPDLAATLVARLMTAGGMFYRNGSGALMLAQVASGHLAGYIEPHMNAWDCLGGLLMVAEAGGRAEVDLPGMLARGGPVLAAAPAAHDALSGVVAGLY